MAYQYMPKIFNDPPQNISAPSPSYILNVRSLNWKSQFFFITKHINTNDVFCFNFAKIFFSNRKPNPIIIKIINTFFIFPCNSFCMYFYWLTCLKWHHEKHFWSLFLMSISTFFDFLIQQVILCKNFPIMVYNLKR